MVILEKEKQEMVRLAREGKQIAKIWSENYPQYDYWEIYQVVYEGGESSARGMKSKITTRLNKLVDATTKAERQKLVDEVSQLVSELYENHRSNQKRIDEIRRVINS